MRICHLAKYYPPAPGGIERHVQDLARGQAALGAQVEVVCANHADPSGRDVTWSVLGRTRTTEEVDEPVRVIRVGRVANLARLDLCPRLPSVLLRRSLGAADVLHVHLPNPVMLLGLAALPLRPLLAVTVHSDVVRQRLLRHALRPLEEWTLRRARLVLATSPPYAASSPLLRRFPEKTQVLPFGIDLTPFSDPSQTALARRDELAARFQGPRWLMVGRLVYYKGHSVALRALRSVPGTLLIVGEGPLEADLRREAGALGVADRVAFLGRLDPDRLVGAYAAATALWFPSVARSEAFGLVQVEAMASRLPVINTAIPGSGVAWVSPSGETGLTVAPNHPEALAAAAERLLQEPGLGARLGEGGARRATAHFGQGRMAHRSLELYESALTERRTGRPADEEPSRRAASYPL